MPAIGVNGSELLPFKHAQSLGLNEQVIAVLGHDLSNPLASIDCSVRMLVKEPLSSKGATLVGLIRSSVGRPTELIDNVLDLARGPGTGR